MVPNLTVWITPFTGVTSLDEAIGRVEALSLSAGAVPNLLLPTHFGQWPQAECKQTLPPDLLVAGPTDVAPIRQRVEAAGIGFGCWGVPVDLTSPELAAGFADAGGYYVANFEPDQFWTPGDDPAAVDEWWSRYWNALPAPDALSGNTAATVVPNAWGLDAFKNSLPNLWPTNGFTQVRAIGVEANLIPIVAKANLPSQKTLAAHLGNGNIHVWCL